MVLLPSPPPTPMSRDPHAHQPAGSFFRRKENLFNPPSFAMRPAQILLNQAKKNARPSVPVPVEMYPLFAACGVAVCSLGYFTYRHFAYDQQLRLWKNADLSRVDEVLNKAAAEDSKAESQSESKTESKTESKAESDE